MDQETASYLGAYSRRKVRHEIGELWELPNKPQRVIDFERLSDAGKEKVRESPQWPELARYYDRYHDVIQHNVGEHAWRQQIGYEPRGKVEYVNGTYTEPLRRPIPKEQQWEIGPDNFWHRPECPYRLSDYQKLECDCHRGRRQPKAKKDLDQVPF